MIATVYLRVFHLFCLLLLLPATGVWAQQVVFTASANAAKVGRLDEFQVTYTIQGVGGGATFNPGESLKDFNVLAGPFRYHSTSVRQAGNQMVQSSSITFTFVLQAKRTGKIRLAPAIVESEGNIYKSNPLQVEVVAGSLAPARPRRAPAASPWGDDEDPFGSDPFAALRQQQARIRQLMSAAPGQFNPQQQRTQQQAAPKPETGRATLPDISKDIFIRVEVDKKSVKLGEQVTAVYKLYSRIPMRVSMSKLPSLNGFWTQDFEIPEDQRKTEELVNNKRYQVFLLKKSALFPQQPGKLTLDAAEAEGIAHVAVQSAYSSPFDDPFLKQAFGSLMMDDPFFSDPYGGSGYAEVPVHLKSTPVHIQVQDLPTGKPEQFAGAVGDFSLSAAMDKTSLTTDQVATLTLTISGSGNLKLFEAPELTLPDGLSTYTPNVFDTITGRSTTISGQKVITYSIAPRKAGNYQIPPLTLAWFDPKSNSYKTASTPSFRLKVSPGKAMVATADAGRVGGSEDIRDQLNTVASRPLVLSPLYWSMYALPLLLLAGVTFYRRREDSLIADSVHHRNRMANKVAQKRLAAAGSMLQKDDARGFYDEISKAIWLYLSDKLNIPLSTLGKDAALTAMAARGIPTPVQQQIQKVLGECELALYASSGNNHQMQQTFSEAACIITGLERTLRAS